MKLNRELIIRGEPAQVSGLMDEAERRADGAWVRDRREERISRERDEQLRTLYAFYTPPRDADRTALYFHEREPGAGYRSTLILPGQATPWADQDSSRIEDFHTRLIGPIAGLFGVEAELTSDRFDEREWFSEDAAEKLHRFDRMANKGTGGANLADRRRWLDFIVTSHRDGNRLPRNLLERWLIVEGCWDYDYAARLADEYAFGGEILEYSLGQPG